MNYEFPCGRQHRRQFLSDCGLGFTGLALAAVMQQDAQAAASPRLPHFTPKAKSVIWFFMNGGTSHLESFDPKPALNKYAGMTIDESPYKFAVLSKKRTRFRWNSAGLNGNGLSHANGISQTRRKRD